MGDSEARGSSRELTEAKNIISPPRIRICPRGALLDLRATVPDPLHGQTGRPRKPTEAYVRQTRLNTQAILSKMNSMAGVASKTRLTRTVSVAGTRRLIRVYG